MEVLFALGEIRIVGENAPPFRRRAQHQRRGKTALRDDGFFDGGRDGLRFGGLRLEHDVAALDIGLDAVRARRLEQPDELRHGQALGAADVDPAQQSEMRAQLKCRAPAASPRPIARPSPRGSPAAARGRARRAAPRYGRSGARIWHSRRAAPLSGSTSRWRARLATANSRSPISSRTAPASPASSSASTSSISSRILASTARGSFQSKPTLPAFSCSLSARVSAGRASGTPARRRLSLARERRRRAALRRARASPPP